MDLDRKINIGRNYRHFKGGVYTVLYVAKDCEDLSDVVVYKNIINGSVWIRSLKDFLSNVDKEKYPCVEEKFRFTEMV